MVGGFLSVENVMAYEIKEKNGSLFENDDKKQANSPDYTGMIKIDGKLWRIAGWAREAKSGKVYLSLAISEPQTESRGNVGLDDPRFQAMRERMKKAGEEKRKEIFGDGNDADDDDIPF